MILSYCFYFHYLYLFLKSSK